MPTGELDHVATLALYDEIKSLLRTTLNPEPNNVVDRDFTYIEAVSQQFIRDSLQKPSEAPASHLIAVALVMAAAELLDAYRKPNDYGTQIIEVPIRNGVTLSITANRLTAD